MDRHNRYTASVCARVSHHGRMSLPEVKGHKGTGGHQPVMEPFVCGNSHFLSVVGGCLRTDMKLLSFVFLLIDFRKENPGKGEGSG